MENHSQEMGNLKRIKWNYYKRKILVTYKISLNWLDRAEKIISNKDRLVKL